MPIRDVALKICRKQWTIRRCGERGSGIFVLIARHDHIYIYIYMCEAEVRFSLGEKLIRWYYICYWLFLLMGFKCWDIDRGSLWQQKGLCWNMLKNLRLETFHVSILVSLWTFLPTLVNIYIYIEGAQKSYICKYTNIYIYVCVCVCVCVCVYVECVYKRKCVIYDVILQM